MNRKLESMTDGVGAAVLYVMDSSGSTLASSNWRSETSFVGHNFAFRPYFKKALLEGKGESFALGSVSQRSGFYVAHSVEAPSRVVLGVIVMKIQFDDLVEQWGRGNTHVIVTDEHDVVLLADVTAWQMHTLEKLPHETAMAIRESMQFGDAELTPLPLAVRPAEDDVSLVDGTLEGDEKGRHTYLKIATPIAGTAWKMHTLTPVEPRMSRQIAIAVLITALAVLAVATAMTLWWYRRRQIHLQAAEQLRVMERLEELVRERTAELTRSNQKLHNLIRPPAIAMRRRSP